MYVCVCLCPWGLSSVQAGHFKLGALWFVNVLHEGLGSANLGPLCTHAVQPEREALICCMGILFASLFYLFIVPVSHLCQY